MMFIKGFTSVFALYFAGVVLAAPQPVPQTGEHNPIDRLRMSCLNLCTFSASLIKPT